MLLRSFSTHNSDAYSFALIASLFLLGKEESPVMTGSMPNQEKRVLPKPLTAFADGACSGNPGPGGWGLILVVNQEVRELGGYSPATTNNQMELMAAIRALEETAQFSDLEMEIYSDSKYVIQGITEWIWGWMRRGWINSAGKPVANQELWERLFRATQKRKVSWKYIPGHAGFPGNDRADEIAVSFSRRAPEELFDGILGSYPHDLHKVP